jgi:hypothetical protein
MRAGILQLSLAVAIFGGVSAAMAFAQGKADAVSAPVAPAVVIQVKDPSGAAIPKAQVRVAPMPEKMPERMQTDDNGELAMQLSAGTHELVVMCAGFKTFSSQIEVKDAVKPQVIPVVLQIGNVSGPLVIGDPVKPVKDALVLSVSPFSKKFTISLAELKAMPRKTVKIHNAHSNADETYSGVELSDLLQKYGAPLGKELRGPALAYYVVATGTDGYKAVYALAEVDPSFHPGDVLVADTMDGKPLDEHSGPLRLVSTEDLRPARGVRNLIGIEVKVAE